MKITFELPDENVDWLKAQIKAGIHLGKKMMNYKQVAVLLSIRKGLKQAEKVRYAKL